MSRDPLRIPALLARLQAVWEKYPDMRLGQLICTTMSGHPFYVEDEPLIRDIESVLGMTASTE